MQRPETRGQHGPLLLTRPIVSSPSKDKRETLVSGYMQKLTIQSWNVLTVFFISMGRQMLCQKFSMVFLLIFSLGSMGVNHMTENLTYCLVSDIL